MKSVLITILSITLIGGFNDIATVNELKNRAKKAYNAGNYEEALNHYVMLTDSLGVKDENIAINLANTYYKLNDTTEAINSYSSVLGSLDRSIRTVAHQQLGIINNKNKKFEEALSHFKESLKADPTNEESRYNYELLKKILDEQKKQQDQNKDQQNEDQNKDQQKNKDQQQNKDQEQNKDKQNEDQQQQDQKNKDGEQKDQEEKSEQEKKEEQGKEEEQKKEQQPEDKEGNPEDEKQANQDPSFSEKLKEMKISEEKAKMILEAMKNNEIQYYQQNKRKAKKKKDPDKPDW
ncbi:MAG: hypothetical protein RLO81_09065 [Fulvivirga sp.]|uniref:hypothetical protein n=1 Tax=Fulvivirga sp. TaxID=1931237 RepID=UPI0032EEC336